MKHYKCRGKFLATNLAIFRPLKNLAMSWSDDCHGNPLARITALSSTSSILLLQAQKEGVMETHLPVASATYHPLCLSPVLQGQAAVPALSAGRQCQGSEGQVPPPSKAILHVSPQGMSALLSCSIPSSPFLLHYICSLSSHLFDHVPNLLPAPLSELCYWYSQALAVLILARLKPKQSS